MHDGFIIKPEFINKINYNGTYNKFGITVDGVNYIVKMEKEPGQSSCISECLVSRLINRLGIQCQQTWLGYYNDNLVVIIEDFTKSGEVLHTFGQTGQSSEATDLSTKLYTYKDVVYLIDCHTKLSKEVKQRALEQFWDMFFCDALFGNRDRHQDNWGYIASQRGWRVAPIFDNGSSLFPDVYKVIDEFSFNDKNFLSDRCEKFPASVFRVTDDTRIRRSNFYEEIGKISGGLELSRLKIFREKLSDFKIILKDELDRVILFLPNSYYEFYQSVILMRMYHIIYQYDVDISYERMLHDVRASRTLSWTTSIFG